MRSPVGAVLILMGMALLAISWWPGSSQGKLTEQQAADYSAAAINFHNSQHHHEGGKGGEHEHHADAASAKTEWERQRSLLESAKNSAGTKTLLFRWGGLALAVIGVVVVVKSQGTA